jgi:hypothetical protein
MRRLFAILCFSLVSAASAGDLRDPMRPSGAAPATPRAAAPASLRLEGVIAGAEMVAIVNGRVVRTGDVVASAKVIKIFAHGVRVLRAGRVQTLELTGTRPVANISVARSGDTKKPEAKVP